MALVKFPIIMGELITKTHVRKSSLHYRILLDEKEYTVRNESMVKHVEAFLNSISFLTLHVFLPISKNHEPDIRSLFSLLWQQGKTLVTSSTDFKTKEMEHFIFERNTQLVVSAKGIPEPINARSANTEDIQVIFVPLVAADLQGNRIGYGGGYYDRFLHETKALKIGLSLSPPLDIIQQTEQWDISLNHLITPFKTYNYG